MPMANGSRRAEEIFYPLELLQCSTCSLVQLSYVVPPEIIFHEDYPYSSGNSPQLRKHFEELARKIRERAEPSDLIVDVGGNDGTLLSNLEHKGYRLLTIDATTQVHKAPAMSLMASFTSDLAKLVRSEHGPAKVITACNVLAHVEDIHDVLEGIRELLHDDGVLITENGDLRIIAEGQWDTVYHEHLRYYTPFTFSQLLEDHGLTVWREHGIDTHGGSFRTYSSKTTKAGLSRTSEDPHYDFAEVQRDAAYSRAHLRSMISSVRAGGARVVGISSTARASTVISYCGLTEADLDCVYEVPGSDKIDKYMPGTRIPVRSEDEGLFNDSPEYALLFSHHLRDFLVPMLRQKHYQGSIILPVPKFELIRSKPRD
jgi:hypothetical protein